MASQIAALLSPGLEVDFNQDYLLAEAIRHGIDPNMGLHQLAVALGMPGLIQADYPTPHPPTAGLLLLPLAWLPQTIASVVWLLVSFGALTWAIALLSRLAGIRLPAWLILPVSLAALFWEPLSQDVGWGQMNAIMLALLAGVLVALSTNRRTLAGVLLAVSLLLKPVAWPLLLLLLVRRDWRAAGSCLLVGGVVGVITAIAVGPLRLVDYFIHSLPVATAYFRLDAFNISLASLGTRLFVGAEYPP
ncbi:MAG TPA: glycosyltransferase family 87 protein, partial [Chloroflexota bacterium]